MLFKCAVVCNSIKEGLNEWLEQSDGQNCVIVDGFAALGTFCGIISNGCFSAAESNVLLYFFFFTTVFSFVDTK